MPALTADRSRANANAIHATIKMFSAPNNDTDALRSVIPEANTREDGEWLCDWRYDQHYAWDGLFEIGKDFVFKDVFEVLVGNEDPIGVDNRPLRIKMDGSLYLDEQPQIEDYWDYQMY